MQAKEVPLTSELLCELGASTTNNRGRAFFLERSRIYLIVTWEGSNQDTWEDYFLFRAGIEYRIKLRHRVKGRNKLFPVFMIHSPVSLKQHEITRLREKGKKLVEAYTQTTADKGFELSVIDDTKPIKPKSIALLKKILYRFASMTDKSIICSPLLENFIPLVFSVEESERFSAHLHRTNGRDVSLVSILIFQLAYEKYKLKQCSNANKST